MPARPRLVALLLVLTLLAGCVMNPGDVGGGLPDTDGDGDQQPPPARERPDPPAEGTYSITLTVDAAQGPHGQDALAEIDRRFYGVNIADWRTEDYRGEGDPTFLAYLKALEPGVLRWPAGHSGQEYQWERAPEAQGARRVLSIPNVEAFLALCKEVGAEPLLAVNLKTGTPEAAADFVRYVNIEQGHGVTWWQIGNEPDHLDGQTESPQQYAHRTVEFAEAMRAVDPSIKIVGAEIMTGVHITGTSSRESWMEIIAEIAGHEMDALGWHYYPLDSGQPSTKSSAYPTVEHLFQEVGTSWRPSGMSFVDEVTPRLHEIRDAHSPGSEIWVTEIAEDSGGGGAAGIADGWSGGLWTADIMGRFASWGTDAMMRFVFKSGETHRYTMLDKYNELRPNYYVYWVMANHFGNRVTHAESDDIRSVNVHASLREDGRLAVMIVNKQTEAYDARLSIEGFDTNGGISYLITGDSYETGYVELNGERLSPENVATGPEPEQVSLSVEDVVHVPPLSVRMLVLDPYVG